MSEERALVWAKALALLDPAQSKATLKQAGGTVRSRECATLPLEERTSVIRIVERLDTETMLLSWSDPLSGHSAEETWRKGLAKRSGKCLLSDTRLRRGDSVYRRSTRMRISHADGMIAAGCIEGVPEGGYLRPHPAPRLLVDTEA
ncbi:DUF3331 domain-containing protein [Paraburkholderia tropica]|uniref:DUF3331 domain-containing protein n=1 Tax=Paraburkholderia tropica TaxID=92647 RepID=UPI002AB6FEBA|nr:DUF3331 domain-containing protein [Paraburkholderia tropica]